jgi:hypothetical protein
MKVSIFLTIIIVASCSGLDDQGHNLDDQRLTTEELEKAIDLNIEKNIIKFININWNDARIKNFNELISRNSKSVTAEYLYISIDDRECELSVLPNAYKVEDSLRYKIEFQDSKLGEIINYRIKFQLSKELEVIAFYAEIYSKKNGETHKKILLDKGAYLLKQE